MRLGEAIHRAAQAQAQPEAEAASGGGGEPSGGGDDVVDAEFEEVDRRKHG
jgi:hypothetical protein